MATKQPPREFCANIDCEHHRCDYFKNGCMLFDGVAIKRCRQCKLVDAATCGTLPTIPGCTNTYKQEKNNG